MPLPVLGTLPSPLFLLVALVKSLLDEVVRMDSFVLVALHGFDCLCASSTLVLSVVPTFLELLWHVHEMNFAVPRLAVRRDVFVFHPIPVTISDVRQF